MGAPARERATGLRLGALDFVVSSSTLPFWSSWRISELPPLALVQLPKVLPASWLRRDMVRHVLGPLGLSSGAPSPDMTFARPYALDAVYLAFVATLLLLAWRRRGPSRPKRRWVLVLLGAAAIEFLLSLSLLRSDGTVLY